MARNWDTTSKKKRLNATEKIHYKINSLQFIKLNLLQNKPKAVKLKYIGCIRTVVRTTCRKGWILVNILIPIDDFSFSLMNVVKCLACYNGRCHFWTVMHLFTVELCFVTNYQMTKKYCRQVTESGTRYETWQLDAPGVNGTKLCYR